MTARSPSALFPATARIRYVFCLAVFVVAGACGREVIDLGVVKEGTEAGAEAGPFGDSGSLSDSGLTEAGPAPTDAAPPPPFTCTSDDMCGPLVCHEESQRCVECTEGAHCIGFYENQCDPVSHRCVNCIANAAVPTCPAGYACDPLLQICWIACSGDENCVTPLGSGVCDLARGICVMCVESTDCEKYGADPSSTCVLGVCTGFIPGGPLPGAPDP